MHSKDVTLEHNQILMALTTLEEVERMVKEMAIGKSKGLDRVSMD